MQINIRKSLTLFTLPSLAHKALILEHATPGDISINIECIIIDVPGAWQLPQGGIDVGEKPQDAAFRELLEETGLDSNVVTLRGEYPEWLAYELPLELRGGKYLGQVQHWFIFALEGDESNIDPGYDNHQEFSQYRWIDIDQLTATAIGFRKPIYKKISDYIVA